MAVEIFLRLDGVEGGSRNYHHQGWADVLSFSWGLSRAGGRSNGAATSWNDIAIVKAIGKESPALMALCAAGTEVAGGAISVVPVVGKREQQKKYVVITMAGIVIKSIATGGNTEESFMREKVTLRFGRMEYEFFEPGVPDGSGEGAEAESIRHVFSWDGTSGAAH